MYKRQVRDALRPALFSARIPRFDWKSGDLFSAELWLLNDSPETVSGPVRAVLEIGGTEYELLNWQSGSVAANENRLSLIHILWESEQARIELYGSEGSLRVPDPNTFGGPIQLLRPGQKEWENVPVIYGYQENSRGLGVVDMCCAIRQGRKARANSDQTFHVLDRCV